MPNWSCGIDSVKPDGRPATKSSKPSIGSARSPHHQKTRRFVICVMAGSSSTMEVLAMYRCVRFKPERSIVAMGLELTSKLVNELRDELVNQLELKRVSRLLARFRFSRLFSGCRKFVPPLRSDVLILLLPRLRLRNFGMSAKRLALTFSSCVLFMPSVCTLCRLARSDGTSVDRSEPLSMTHPASLIASSEPAAGELWSAAATPVLGFTHSALSTEHSACVMFP